MKVLTRVYIDSVGRYREVTSRYFGRFLLNNADSERWFHLDEFSGCVRLKRRLDYETNRRHEFKVTASGGAEGRTAMSKVVIRVIDVDENRFPPLFDEIARQVEILFSPSS